MGLRRIGGNAARVAGMSAGSASDQWSERDERQPNGCPKISGTGRRPSLQGNAATERRGYSWRPSRPPLQKSEVLQLEGRPPCRPIFSMGRGLPLTKEQALGTSASTKTETGISDPGYNGAASRTQRRRGRARRRARSQVPGSRLGRDRARSADKRASNRPADCRR